jgi:outer membrane protein insertion porin family
LRVLYYIFIGIVSMFLLFGCSSTKHLKDNEYLLYRNSLKGAPKDHYSPLTDLYKQRNNRKILGTLPYVNLYNFGKIFLDTAKVIRKREKVINKFDLKIQSAKTAKKRSKLTNRKDRKVKRKELVLSEGNAFMRSFGEPPEIFDSLKVLASILSMKSYLFSKGYFHNTVSAEIDTARRKRVTVRYTVLPGEPFLIDTIIYDIDDPRIDSLLNKTNLFTRVVKQNENYDEDKINTEREGIYKLMKDNGYFNFQRQDIYFEVDSLQEPYEVDITVFVNRKHEVYRVSKLYFNMNDAGDRYDLKPDTFLYKNVYYTYYKRTYLRKLLDYKIAIRPYDIYNQSKFQMTQRLLGSMDMYKFVNVNITENKTDTASHTLTAYINTQPLNKFQLSQEYGLSVGQALIPGPFLSVTLKTRNIFRWLEVIENTFRYSFEAQYTNVSSDVPYRAREFSAFTSIGLSQLLFPTPLRRIVRNYYPKVRFYTGYTFVLRPEYRRESFRSGLTYSFTRNAFSSLFVTPIDVSYIDSKLDPAYNTFLQQLRDSSGSNLYLSFNPSIVTGFQVSYVYNNHELNSRKVTKFFRPFFEFGGIVPTLVARQYASSEDKDSSRLFGKQIFEFIRLGLDVRYYIPVQKTNSFVVRFNMGYAQPFGVSSKAAFYALPYEKYFFAGGNSSIRAWKPRRLGPGSYDGNSQNGYLYEQPGEILFESNYEYRFKMVGIFNGALFVDAGNVWTIKDDKPGTQFKLSKALSDLAVGAGVGLRLDFSFLVLRLDLAHRVLDPARPEGDKLVDKFRTSQIVYNIGIGYPF